MEQETKTYYSAFYGKNQIIAKGLDCKTYPEAVRNRNKKHHNVIITETTKREITSIDKGK